MAYHGKNITGMSCFMVVGISLKATTISSHVRLTKFPLAFSASILANSSGVGGYSEVVSTVTKIVAVEAMAPIPNAQ